MRQRGLHLPSPWEPRGNAAWQVQYCWKVACWVEATPLTSPPGALGLGFAPDGLVGWRQWTEPGSGTWHALPESLDLRARGTVADSRVRLHLGPHSGHSHISEVWIESWGAESGHVGKRARHSHCCRPELRESPRRLRSKEGRDQHPQMRPGELGLTQDGAAHPERWGSGQQEGGKDQEDQKRAPKWLFCREPVFCQMNKL